MTCASVVPMSFWITSRPPARVGGGGEAGMVEFQLCGAIEPGHEGRHQWAVGVG